MVTASIVLYNVKKTELLSIVQCGIDSPIDYLYIIDNSPINECESLIRNKSKRIIYIFNNCNIGYGSGHNIAIKEAIKLHSDYHIILNPDIFFEKDVIKKLIEYMANNEDCGLIMPKVLYPNGELQFLCKLLPTPLDLFARRFIPIRKYNLKRDFKYELRFTGYNKIMEVPSLSGCFMFLRVSVLKEIGGFDERYFMYAEDLDLSRRVNEVAKTIYYPDVFITHKHEKGSYRNRKLLSYHVVSVIKYFNKWGWFFDKKRKLINNKILKELK